MYTRKLEIVHKEVGGCLISYNLQLACVRKLEVSGPNGDSLTFCRGYELTQVGMELLGHSNFVFIAVFVSSVSVLKKGS